MIKDSPLLQADAVGRRAAGPDRWLLRDVGLEVRAGDRFAVVGPSGAGKTLLLRALALLDPLDSGRVLWQGGPVGGNRVPDFRRQVVYVHQRPCLMEGTVEANLRQPFQLKVHRCRQFDPDCIASMLQTLDRDASFLAKRQRDLSGGEAQIVALLRAVQLDPQVLLLDEPTAALDQAAALAVESLLDGWLRQSPERRAMVWVCHDPQLARRVAGRVLRMEQGKLLDRA
jgi:putative ABC transport system ATP-binding protein